MGRSIPDFREQPIFSGDDARYESLTILKILTDALQQAVGHLQNAQTGHFDKSAPDLLHCAQRLEKERRKRSRFFPKEFTRDPAWPMLVELFRCSAESVELPITSLALGLDIPMATSRRWIEALVENGLVRRWHSTRDARQTLVQLSDDGLWRMEQYLLDIGR